MNENETTDLVRADGPSLIEHKLQDPRFVALLRDMYFKGCDEIEVQVGLEHCRHLQLDPIAQEIWFVKIWDSDLRREVVTPFVGINGLRKAAHRTGEYEGPEDPEWCGPDGVWRDVWLEKSPPAAARVRVHRRGFRQAVAGVVTYTSAVQTKKNGQPRAKWASAPAEMLAKCAEALALRRAFEKLASVKVDGVDRVETAEERSFRVRDDSPKLAGDKIAHIIEAIGAAFDLTELEKATGQLKGIELTEEQRAAARDAWQRANQRIRPREDREPEPAPPPEPAPEPQAEHDYGPPAMTDAEVAAVESGAQSGFGFDDKPDA